MRLWPALQEFDSPIPPQKIPAWVGSAWLTSGASRATDKA